MPYRAWNKTACNNEMVCNIPPKLQDFEKKNPLQLIVDEQSHLFSHIHVMLIVIVEECLTLWGTHMLLCTFIWHTTMTKRTKNISFLMDFQFQTQQCGVSAIPLLLCWRSLSRKYKAFVVQNVEKVCNYRGLGTFGSGRILWQDFVLCYAIIIHCMTHTSADLIAFSIIIESMEVICILANRKVAAQP